MLKTTFSGPARRRRSATSTPRTSAKVAAVVPQPSRMAKANVSAVVASWVPARGSRTGIDSLRNRHTTRAQKTGGSRRTVASPPSLARIASSTKPTVETVSA